MCVGGGEERAEAGVRPPHWQPAWSGCAMCGVWWAGLPQRLRPAALMGGAREEKKKRQAGALEFCCIPARAFRPRPRARGGRRSLRPASTTTRSELVMPAIVPGTDAPAPPDSPHLSLFLNLPQALAPLRSAPTRRAPRSVAPAAVATPVVAAAAAVPKKKILILGKLEWVERERLGVWWRRGGPAGEEETPPRSPPPLAIKKKISLPPTPRLSSSPSSPRLPTKKKTKRRHPLHRRLPGARPGQGRPRRHPADPGQDARDQPDPGRHRRVLRSLRGRG